MTETPMLQGVRDNPDLKGALEAIPVPLNRTANVDEIARYRADGQRCLFLHAWQCAL